MVKRALVVGLNYSEVAKEKRLKCGVRNARRFKNSLIKNRKFRSRDIVLLTDDDPASKRKKSCVEITALDLGKQLAMMIEKCKKGDVLVMYFCGHGNRFKAKKYGNNSGYKERLVCSNKTSFTDTTFRDFVETVPEGCGFTALVDCCHSGAVIEGAEEIIGDSTTHPLIRKRIRKDTRFNLGERSNRSPGILISSCQSYETSRQKLYKKGEGVKGWSTYFTQNLLNVMEETETNYSNVEFVNKVTTKMEYEFENASEEKKKKMKKHKPGLYCSRAQSELKFLSPEVEVIESVGEED